MTSTRKRAAMYARCATLATQNHYPNTLDQQILHCQRYCLEHEYTLNGSHIYQEVASGTDFRNRPRLNALLIAAANQEFEVVVIVAHDRLSRHPLHVARFSEDLQALGIQVECCYQSNDAGEEFLRFLLDVQVEMQHEHIKKRTQQGKARKRERLTLKQDEATIVTQLIEMGASGSPLSEMAAQFTVEGVIDASRVHEGCDTPLGFIEQMVTSQRHLEGR